MFLKNFLYIIFVFFLPALCCMADDEAIKKLIADGFPQSYAVKLAEIKKSRPNWTFEALKISELNPKYTWKYVLFQETDASPSRSLVYGNKLFSAYFHKTDKKKYDAGCRRASTAAVAYFLDPRNFLNEQDIFQFEDLNAPKEIPHSAIANALRDSFMEKEKLENGMTYIQYFHHLGKTFSINPVFLASRARQEQGLRGTPLISGKCGTLLLKYYKEKTQRENGISILTPNKTFNEDELKSYDGLYNFFNINATADGRFLICLNGMREAQEGTPAMQFEWSSPAWNTKWKSLFGGAFKIALRYVGNYQNTAYLQKWNVDPRCVAENGGSRNFWGQYMQNIGAAFSESQNAYKAIKKQNLLDLPFHFLIPVYDGMPEAPSPDPANGKCVYYKNHNSTPAPGAKTPEIKTAQQK